MPRYYLNVCLIVLMTACSKPPEGLWVDTYESAILKFEGSNVIYSSVSSWTFRDTLQFEISGDSLTFIGLDPAYGKQSRSFKYRLNGDSLSVWYEPEHETLYLKSSSDNYLEHFLSKGNVSIHLSKAVSVKEAYYGRHVYLNIKIGLRQDRIVTFVDNVETPMDMVDIRIKRFKEGLGEWERINCRLFIDNRVPCEYMNWLFPILRKNDLRLVTFVTLANDYNVYTEDFWGIRTVLPVSPINIIEE